MAKQTKRQRNWLKRYHGDSISGVRVVTDGSITIEYVEIPAKDVMIEWDQRGIRKVIELEARDGAEQ